jgi:hypothetical protein
MHVNERVSETGGVCTLRLAIGWWWLWKVTRKGREGKGGQEEGKGR